VYVGTQNSVGVFGLLNPPHLNTISAETAVNAERQLDMGFTIRGSEPKTVAVRAVAQPLPANGKSVQSPRPVLELHDDIGRAINSNENWNGKAEPATSAEKGPFMIATLAPSDYTATIRSANGTMENALVEVSDLSSPLTSTFASFRARGFIDAGQVLVAGITVHGSALDQVLFRATRPELGESGKGIANPVLDVRDSNGVLVASNDNWGESPDWQEIMSIGLAPGSEADAALLLTLRSGSYTAVARDGAGGGGLAQLETYELP
jgi:hypothetical protein